MKKLVLLSLLITAGAIFAQAQNADGTDPSNKPGETTTTPATNVQVSTDASGNPIIDKTTADGKTADAIPQGEKIEKKGCFRIASLSMASGMNKYRELASDDKQWDKPQKGNHTWNSGDMGSMMGSGQGEILTRNLIVLEMGLNPWSKKLGDYNRKRELSISLFYSGSNLTDRFSEEFQSRPGDTFSFNSANYQTDTVSRIQNSYLIKANVLGAGVQYLFRSDPEKRLSVFAGVGIDAAYALTARIYESYTKDSAVVVSFSGTNADPMESLAFDNGNLLGSEGKKSAVNAKPTMFTSVYVPFGINLKLCRKKEIWNQFNLVLKGNVGLETAIVVGHKTHFNPFMGMSLGLKFDFK